MSWFAILKMERIFGPMGEHEAIEMWNKDNTNDIYQRKSGLYALDEWLIRVIDNKVVGIQGFTNFHSYAFVGGSKSSSPGTLRAFKTHRNKFLGDIPKIGGYRTSRGNNAEYIKAMKRWGIFMNPSSIEGVPQKVIEYFKREYGEDWGVHK